MKHGRDISKSSKVDHKEPILISHHNMSRQNDLAVLSISTMYSACKGKT